MRNAGQSTIRKAHPRLIIGKFGILAKWENSNYRSNFAVPGLPFSHLRNLNLRPKFLYGNDRKSHADLLINGGASFRWSFGPHSAWGSIESTTILTTHPSLHKSEKNIWMSVKPCVFSGPCITSGPWIPIFWPVRGFLYADRSVEPYISEWSLYSDRSMDSYILAGPGIPIFWTVHGFLYSGQSMDPYILQNCII